MGISMAYEQYEQDLKVVQNHLENEQGIKYYATSPGNGCVWVTYGRISAYYVVQQGKVVNVIYD